MTDAEFEELADLEREANEGPPVWMPRSVPQRMAYYSQADVIGYGGAAGGGKSSLSLGLALTKHKRSLLLRREFTNVRGLVDDCRALVGNQGSYNGQSGMWSGLAGGRMIEFGGVPTPGSEQKYRGRPHDFLAFDEADQFPESVVLFLSGWLRTTEIGQRTRMLLGFNPPSSADGRWVLRWFKPWLCCLHPDERQFFHDNPAEPGEIRWYARTSDGREVECENGEETEIDGELIRPKSRTFIPAKVTDNPFFQHTGYESQLASLPEPLRSQLLRGDFTAGLEDESQQVIPTRWIEQAMERWVESPPCPLSAVGVDVARGGRDKTCFAPRHGNWIGKLYKYFGAATPDGPSVVRFLRPIVGIGGASVIIDAIGVGSSVVDECRKLKYSTMAVNFAGATEAVLCGVIGFANIRSFGYWSMRELLDPENGNNFMLPPDDELLADLAAPTYKNTPKGIQVVSKDDLVKKLGRSPDCADAVVYSILQPKR